MNRRLPSLNALRAFEAAQRHRSFTAAAEELFVTHAAISRHIRDLEDWLGVELFRRTGRGVEPTESGERFGHELTPLFDGLAAATRAVMATGETRRLAVTVEPGFASRWLVPRLGRFSALHPDIELAVDPDANLADFHAGTFELGIRSGAGPWEGVDHSLIASFTVFPVCSPSLIEGRSLSSPAALGEFTLLHTYSREWWADWLREAGVSGIEAWRGPMFQNHLAIEAAEAGQGFALGDEYLTADALLEGWLVKPFEVEIREPGGYNLVRLKGSKESAPARAFREWLTVEMAESHRRFASLKA
jgi:LysR family transcriptional regulator, glycine cleavage system transcriptional activator